MTKEQAEERLEAIIEARVAPRLAFLQKELLKAKQDKLAWFYAGYDCGISDDPNTTDVEGIRKLTLEQRKVKAAAKHTIATRAAEGKPPIELPQKKKRAPHKPNARTRHKKKATSHKKA